MRRYTVLGYQEFKSLTGVERRRLLDGETRIQQFLEEIIAYGVEQRVFPPGNVDVKAHCLMVLSQSWAVRHWALTRFAKAEDYLLALKTIVLGIIESETVPVAEVIAVRGKEKNEDLLQSREP